MESKNHLVEAEQVARNDLHVDVVQQEPAYIVVQKNGRAAEITKELDPR